MTDNSELARRMKDWGCPARALRIAMEGPRETQAIGHTRSFLGEFQQGNAGILVLAGGVGVGKTIASVWAMTQIPGHGVRRFRHVSEICDMGRFESDEERRDRQAVKQSKVLVLDDLGTEHKTDLFQTMFDGLMNARYESDGMTVLTMNLTSEQFLERYGKRIYDRVRGRGHWYEISHDSLRGQP